MRLPSNYHLRRFMWKEANTNINSPNRRSEKGCGISFDWQRYHSLWWVVSAGVQSSTEKPSLVPLLLLCMKSKLNLNENKFNLWLPGWKDHMLLTTKWDCVLDFTSERNRSRTIPIFLSIHTQAPSPWARATQLVRSSKCCGLLNDQSKARCDCGFWSP